MRTFEVTCPDPDCNEEFDADVQDEALLPDAECFDVACPECGAEWVIVYDLATDTVSLEDSDDLVELADETDLTEEDSSPSEDEED